MTDGCQQSFSPRYSQTYGSGLSGTQWFGGVSSLGRAVVVTSVALAAVAPVLVGLVIVLVEEEVAV